MRVTEVIVRRLSFAMGGGLRNPYTQWDRKRAVLVFVVSDTGHVGVGEAWVGGASSEALARTIMEDIAPRIQGEDPHFTTRLNRRAAVMGDHTARPGIIWAAAGAVDMALMDLVARIHGLPLYKLLGAARDEVYAYASAGLYGEGKSVDDLAREMAGYVGQGFTGVKMKVGGAPLAEDVARVAAVREAVGEGVRLMIDAVYCLDAPRALAMARAVAGYDVTWFEAPVSPRDVAGAARVNALGPIPVCGNESEAGIDRFRALIDARAVEFVQFDLAACGGMSEARRIAALAGAHHLPCTLHASSTLVVFLASLHAAAALGEVESLEYHMVHQWLFAHAPAGMLAVRDGMMALPDGPGIGVALTPDDVTDDGEESGS